MVKAAVNCSIDAGLLERAQQAGLPLSDLLAVAVTRALGESDNNGCMAGVVSDSELCTVASVLHREGRAAGIWEAERLSRGARCMGKLLTTQAVFEAAKAKFPDRAAVRAFRAANTTYET